MPTNYSAQRSASHGSDLQSLLKQLKHSSTGASQSFEKILSHHLYLVDFIKNIERLLGADDFSKKLLSKVIETILELPERYIERHQIKLDQSPKEERGHHKSLNVIFTPRNVELMSRLHAILGEEGLQNHSSVFQKNDSNKTTPNPQFLPFDFLNKLEAVLSLLGGSKDLWHHSTLNMAKRILKLGTQSEQEKESIQQDFSQIQRSAEILAMYSRSVLRQAQEDPQTFMSSTMHELIHESDDEKIRRCDLDENYINDYLFSVSEAVDSYLNHLHVNKVPIDCNLEKRLKSDPFILHRISNTEKQNQNQKIIKLLMDDVETLFQSVTLDSELLRPYLTEIKTELSRNATTLKQAIMGKTDLKNPLQSLENTLKKLEPHAHQTGNNRKINIEMTKFLMNASRRQKLQNCKKRLSECSEFKNLPFILSWSEKIAESKETLNIDFQNLLTQRRILENLRQQDPWFMRKKIARNQYTIDKFTPDQNQSFKRWMQNTLNQNPSQNVLLSMLSQEVLTREQQHEFVKNVKTKGSIQWRFSNLYLKNIMETYLNTFPRRIYDLAQNIDLNPGEPMRLIQDKDWSKLGREMSKITTMLSREALFDEEIKEPFTLLNNQKKKTIATIITSLETLLGFERAQNVLHFFAYEPDSLFQLHFSAAMDAINDDQLKEELSKLAEFRRFITPERENTLLDEIMEITHSRQVNDTLYVNEQFETLKKELNDREDATYCYVERVQDLPESLKNKFFSMLRDVLVLSTHDLTASAAKIAPDTTEDIKIVDRMVKSPSFHLLGTVHNVLTTLIKDREALAKWISHPQRSKKLQKTSVQLRECMGEENPFAVAASLLVNNLLSAEKTEQTPLVFDLLETDHTHKVSDAAYIQYMLKLVQQSPSTFQLPQAFTDREFRSAQEIYKSRLEMEIEPYSEIKKHLQANEKGVIPTILKFIQPKRYKQKMQSEKDLLSWIIKNGDLYSLLKKGYPTGEIFKVNANPPAWCLFQARILEMGANHSPIKPENSWNSCLETFANNEHMNQVRLISDAVSSAKRDIQRQQNDTSPSSNTQQIEHCPFLLVKTKLSLWSEWGRNSTHSGLIGTHHKLSNQTTQWLSCHT